MGAVPPNCRCGNPSRCDRNLRVAGVWHESRARTYVCGRDKRGHACLPYCIHRETEHHHQVCVRVYLDYIHVRCVYLPRRDVSNLVSKNNTYTHEHSKTWARGVVNFKHGSLLTALLQKAMRGTCADSHVWEVVEAVRHQGQRPERHRSKKLQHNVSKVQNAENR